MQKKQIPSKHSSPQKSPAQKAFTKPKPRPKSDKLGVEPAEV